jgi:hypothetical protein
MGFNNITLPDNISSSVRWSEWFTELSEAKTVINNEIKGVLGSRLNFWNINDILDFFKSKPNLINDILENILKRKLKQWFKIEFIFICADGENSNDSYFIIDEDGEQTNVYLNEEIISVLKVRYNTYKILSGQMPNPYLKS